MLLANEGELQRATSLLLNGLLGLFTDYAPPGGMADD